MEVQTEPKSDVNRRLFSLDILRGLAMVLMLLDHTRDFWNSGTGVDPLDLFRSTPVLFFTRWITHFCAPIFILLTGVSVYLAKNSKHQSHRDTFFLLLRRGILLILMEITLISLCWGHFIFSNGIELQVIWVIGISMISLGILQYMPSRWVGLLGLLLIFFHNLIPEYHFTNPFLNTVWSLLHQRNLIPITDHWEIKVTYPFIPWVGVMAFGYALGEIFLAERALRKRALFIIGGAFIVAFVLLRGLNLYGNPTDFKIFESPLRSLFSFLKVEKYPPSLSYLLMTLGPVFLLLPFLERFKLKEGNPLIVFGRTPFLFYIIHLYLLLLTSLVTLAVMNLLGFVHGFSHQIPFKFNIILTFILWLMYLWLIYPICKWYHRLKFSRRYMWTYYV